MAAICHSPIGGRTVRLTRLSSFGEPVTGTCSTITSSGWVRASMSDQVDQPDQFRIRIGAAVTCLAVRDRPRLDWVDATIDFCAVDPELLGMVTAATVIDDADGDAVGWAADTGSYGDANFALELWTGIAGRDACVDGTLRYGYLLLPWLVGGVQGDVTHELGTATFTVRATTQVGNSWGSGPYNVVADGVGAAVPLLTPIPATRHRHWQLTDVPPPAATCGCQTL